jgi:hypothetical protein
MAGEFNHPSVNCNSHCQAPYSLHKKKKGLFIAPYAHLRYYLGGYRPSQTTALTSVYYSCVYVV